MAETAYEIRYTGMDGLDHCEAHQGDAESIQRHVTFLEERGAQGITLDEIRDEEIQGYVFHHRSRGEPLPCGDDEES